MLVRIIKYNCECLNNLLQYRGAIKLSDAINLHQSNAWRISADFIMLGSNLRSFDLNKKKRSSKEDKKPKILSLLCTFGFFLSPSYTYNFTSSRSGRRSKCVILLISP